MSDSTPAETDFVDELGHDVTEAEKLLRLVSSQTNRRAYTRTAFSAIEGIANNLKLQVLDEMEPRDLSIAELATLREEAYSINGKGEPYAQPRFIRLEDNLAFALRMYMRLHGLECEIDRSGTGWQSFKNALQIRHRVTHPRRADDLMISDVEIGTVELAYGWFMQTVIANMTKVNAHLQSQLEKLK